MVLLVDGERGAGIGVVEQVVDVTGLALDVGPEGDIPVGVERSCAVEPPTDGDP